MQVGAIQVGVFQVGASQVGAVAVEAALVQALARRCGAEARVVIEQGQEVAVTDTLARREAQAEADRLADARTALSADPVVADLQKRFGARFVDGTIKPN